MRLALLTVSALALSGCSWMGGNSGPSYGAHGYYAGAGQCGGYGQSHVTGGYTPVSYGAQGCTGGGYMVANQSAYGAQGFAAQGLGAHGFGSGTTLGVGAPYGHAVPGYSAASASASASAMAGGLRGGASATANASAGTRLTGGRVVNGQIVGSQIGGGHYAGSQFAGGHYGGTHYAGGGVQTVVGAPIYVGQPYPAPYGVPRCTLNPCGGAVSVGGAMPFGLEVGVGMEFGAGGDIFTEKAPGLALGSSTVNTGGSDGIRYSDAFDEARTISGSLAYDVSRSTTLLGTVGYSTAEGSTVKGYQSVDARSPGTLEDIDATFSDLDVWTIEGGVRQYMGNNYAFRPYVAATAGFSHNNDVSIMRNYSSDGVAYDPAPFRYVEAGWNPTASAVFGAEWALGKRAAFGLESGVRWRDNMETLAPSEDRFTVPVKLRGRIAF